MRFTIVDADDKAKYTFFTKLVAFDVAPADSQLDPIAVTDDVVGLTFLAL